MAIKMKFLHYPEKGKIATFTANLSAEYGITADKIPPAYECNRDRLLFAGVSSAKMMDDALSRFLRGLTKEKVQYVALFTDAADATVEEMKNMINSAGATVVDVKKVKGNFLPFLTGVKPEEAAELSAWAKSVIENLPE